MISADEQTAATHGSHEGGKQEAPKVWPKRRRSPYRKLVGLKQWRSVECPTCKALAGQYCVTVDSTKVSKHKVGTAAPTTIHEARKDAYKKAHKPGRKPSPKLSKRQQLGAALREASEDLRMAREMPPIGLIEQALESLVGNSSLQSSGLADGKWHVTASRRELHGLRGDFYVVLNRKRG